MYPLPTALTPSTLAPGVVSVGGIGDIITVNCDYHFAAGDYVEVTAFQNSGGVLNITASGNYSPEFWAHQIG